MLKLERVEGLWVWIYFWPRFEFDVSEKFSENLRALDDSPAKLFYIQITDMQEKAKARLRESHLLAPSCRG